jgi:hypothetical protein
MPDRTNLYKKLLNLFCNSYLVSILVDQLDGKIELRGAPGTEFRITFNVAERS